MKTRNILIAAIGVMALAACNDDYNDQFSDITSGGITGTISRELTLSASDYETIASSDVNKALAEQFAAADTLPSCSAEELAAIGVNHYFTSDTAAQKFIPVLLTSKYSHLGDDGSTVSVTYKKYRYTADYLEMGAKVIGSYTVKSSDYESVWGDEVKASYLTPSTLKQIPSLLKAAIANPREDSIVVVNYVYDDVEPSIGGGSTEPEEPEYTAGEWKQLEVPVYPAGTDWNFVNSGDIDLSAYAGKKVQIGLCYSSTAEIAPTWEIEYLTVCDENGDGIYDYDLKDEEQYNLFTTEGELPDGLSYVWSYSSTYGAKASAYASGTRYATEMYLCSPTLSIKDGYNFNFSHALNYVSGQEPSSMVKVYVREMTVKKGAPKRKSHVVSSLGYNASAAYVYDGSAWEEFSTDDSRLVVVEPSAYVAVGGQCFNNPKAQIPAYLSLCYPYAESQDVYTVIYKPSASTYAMADYEFDGSTWSQNKDTEKTATKTLKFQLDGGEWIPNGAYYSNSFLGDKGDFEEKGVMPDGLTYVWTNTSSYGWKASAYVSGTKYPCTMYLVSPEIDLTSADSPAMTFDEAYRYISAPETANDLLKVLVTADYDATNSESYADDIWTEMELPVRATGDDWTFVNVGSIDLSAFKGKKIRVAFRYQCADANKSAATWEVKNFEIAEK